MDDAIAASADEIIARIEILQRRLHDLFKVKDLRMGVAPTLFGDDANGTRIGGQRMHVYWLGCRGLADISAQLPGQPSVARIGCSTEADIDVRLCSAAADAYASWTSDATGALREEVGYRKWVMQAIRSTRASFDPAITPRTRTIEIVLPPGMTRRQFDQALHTALSPWSLAEAHPDKARFTRYSMGVDRMSQAREIYVGLDPRHDGDRLLGLVERILAAYRAGTPSRRETVRSPQLPFSPPLELRQAPLSPRRSRRMSPAQYQAMQARLRNSGQNGSV